MKRNLILLLCAGMISICLLSGCGKASVEESVSLAETQAEDIASSVDTEESEETISEENLKENEIPALLEDGVYLADFDTDSSMFRVNETYNGKGVLTVDNGKMTIHVALLSKKILNLYPGTAEDAVKEGAVLLQPTIDIVTYSDGISEEVYGFDIPVPYLDEEFDVALIGTKGTWYDHKVSVSNVEPYSGEETAEQKASVSLVGGTGKATIESPAEIIYVDGQAYARLIWSSKNYDYMIVNGEKYLNEANAGEPSVFTVPVVLDEEMKVIGDTVAMSTPHEIEYTLLVELVD